MKFSAVLVVVALLALQSAPRINFVATAQQSGNNATLDAKYPSRVMNAPSQLCPTFCMYKEDELYVLYK